jgi:hypothetical protein
LKVLNIKYFTQTTLIIQGFGSSGGHIPAEASS